MTFEEDAFERLDASVAAGMHFVIDECVAALYGDPLRAVLASHSVFRIDAKEASKSLEQFPGYIEHLVARNLRRGDVLVAIGGGVVQDIVCFLAATLLRGLEWRFYPTTLLAQADSCIGSKSSINVGALKNVLGTFTPPAEVHIAEPVLRTLHERDIRSGIGEMLKVHAIDGPEAFEEIASDYTRLLRKPEVLRHYVRRSLEIKKRIIEEDEFDRGIRNVMNYGHSFGHAIESATAFAIPHGIAVTIGMDMANYVAAELGLAARSHYEWMHGCLAANYAGFEPVPIPFERFAAALAKDKKNTSQQLALILPGRDGRVSRTLCDNDPTLQAACREYLATVCRG